MEHEIIVGLDGCPVLARGDGFTFEKRIESRKNLLLESGKRFGECRIFGSVEGDIFLGYVVAYHISVEEVFHERYAGSHDTRTEPSVALDAGRFIPRHCVLDSQEEECVSVDSLVVFCVEGRVNREEIRLVRYREFVSVGIDELNDGTIGDAL